MFFGFLKERTTYSATSLHKPPTTIAAIRRTFELFRHSSYNNLASDNFFSGKKKNNRLWSLFLWLLFCFKKKRFVSLHWILLEGENGELCQLFEAMFTLYRIALRADTKSFPIWTPFWRVALHFRDRCGAPSLRYRNRNLRASSPIWASPLARAFFRDSFHSPK